MSCGRLPAQPQQHQLPTLVVHSTTPLPRRVRPRATGGNGSSRGGNGHGGSSSSGSRNSDIARGSDSSKRTSLPSPFSDMGAPILSGPTSVLTDAERARLDSTPDGIFWGATARMMQHADPEVLQALTGLYSAVIPSGARLLELGASHSSHLPSGLHLRLCVGLGMNAQELAANSSLHQGFVQDLNLQPLLLDQLDASFDAVVLCNTIQYLTDPETVLHEAARVLRPGGVCVVSFGPDCFRERAWAGWLTRSMSERSELLSRILQANGFDTPKVFDAAAAITAGSSSTSTKAGAGAGSSNIDLQVLVATKLQTWTAGAAPPDAPPVQMRADNVQAWFYKPGLSGLSEAARQQQQQQAGPPAAAQQGPLQQHHGGSSDRQPAPPGQPPLPASNERLLEQWRAAYASLVADAVELGIPHSVIPSLPPDAAPADIQDAVQHLQAMMASFLSAGL